MTDTELLRTELSRRAVLRVGVAAASLSLLSGCQVFGAPSELEAARSELVQALEALDRNDAQEVRLMTIARQISSNARVLVDEHDAFLADFDRLTRNRDVSEPDLQRFAELFSARRLAMRDGLLLLQDELRAELTDEEWTRVVAALNKKANAAKIDPLES